VSSTIEAMLGPSSAEISVKNSANCILKEGKKWTVHYEKLFFKKLHQSKNIDMAIRNVKTWKMSSRFCGKLQNVLDLYFPGIVSLWSVHQNLVISPEAPKNVNKKSKKTNAECRKIYTIKSCCNSNEIVTIKTAYRV
jgi:hypothetical protein